MATTVAFSVLLGLPFVRAMSGSFGLSYPSLEAQVNLKTDGFWHLGGFCFGKDDDHVGVLNVQVDWRGHTPLDDAQVYLVGFDGRKDHWGLISQNWNTSSCDEKLHMADASDSSTQLGVLGPKYTLKIRVRQRTGVRDWHFALLSCGAVEAAPLKLKVEAEAGALSYFEANTQFDSSSCPVLNTGWWEYASSALGFWLMLIFIVICTSCLAISIGRSLRLCHKRARKTSGSDVVIGRPCEMPHDEKVATGHPHDVKEQP